jgi:hypothetical protein
LTLAIHQPPFEAVINSEGVRKQVKLEHAPPNEKLYANPMLGVQATGNSNAMRGAWKPLLIEVDVPTVSAKKGQSKPTPNHESNTIPDNGTRCGC